MANGMALKSGLQAHYGEGASPWKSGENHCFPVSASGGGYGNVMGASPPDAIGYGVVGRQIQHGPDAHFRAYPSTADERTS